MPPVYRETLPNGVRVYLAPNPGVPTLAVKVALRTSYRDEPPGKEGVRLIASHFALSQDRWMERVERWGGWWDPTNYYPEVSAKDYVVHARFLEGAIEVAREMLEAMTHGTDAAVAEALARDLEEAGRSTSSEPSQPNALHQACFEEPFAQADPRSRLPNPGVIGADDLLAYWRGNFMPSRVTVTLVGAFDPREALRLARERLGTVEDRPEPREPNLFARYRADREERRGSPTAMLRVAYPIPPPMHNVDANLLAALLRDRLRVSRPRPEAETAIVDADNRPGMRLFRIGLFGDPEESLAWLDGELASFREAVPSLDVAPARDRYVASLAGRRLIHPYWASWTIAFPSDSLGWNGVNPWREFDRLRALGAREIAEVAGEVLVDGHRTVVLASPQFAEGCAVVREGALLPFPDEPPTPPDTVPIEGPPAAPVSFRSALVRRLAGGQVLFLQDPHVRVVDITGHYPLGLQEEGARAYASGLRSSLPEGLQEGKNVVFDRDLISFRLRFPLADDVGAALARLHAWLAAASPGTASPGTVSPGTVSPGTVSPGTVSPASAWPGLLPGMSFRHEGERPRWTLCVRSPCALPALDAWDLPPPGGASPEGGGDPAGQAFLIPLGALEDPSRYAAALLLDAWLSAGTRTQPRYGPFTLVLPEIPHPAKSERFRIGREQFLALDLGDAPRDEALAWLRSGAGIDVLAGEDPDLFARARGHALGWFQGVFDGAGAFTLPLADLKGALEAGSDGTHFDRVHDALLGMTPEEFLDLARGWLSSARVEAAVPSPSNGGEGR
ncbi:MAG: insulinase family protein [Planctomycetes bacterium]|nr:insulinase family protein [Planctomycetota bacterium]